MRRSPFVVLALAIALSGAGILLWKSGWLADPSSETAGQEQIARGQGLYDLHCAACHGAALEGEANWREFKADGTLPAPPHDDSGHTWHHPDRVLFDITKDGGQSLATGSFTSGMPAFGETLGDDEIWAVLAYIKSRWSERSRSHQEKVTAASE